MFKLTSPPLEASEYGWHLGFIQMRHTSDRSMFVIRFKSDTAEFVTLRYNLRDKANNAATKTFARVDLAVSPTTRNATWALLEKLK